MLSACSSGSDPSLIGTWFTNACEQATDQLGPHEGLWGKGKYTFTENSAITTSVQLYNDSNCSETGILIQPDNPGPTLTYISSETITLQEGIDGHEFDIIFPLDAGPSTTEGFYTINEGSLCFSDNINFNVYSVNTSSGSSTSIDFEKCLVKQP